MSIKMIAIVAIVLVIGGVAYVTRDVLKLVLEAVWNVLKTLWEATWRVATALWNFLVLLRCYLYLARWKVRALWRKRILDTASFVVGSALVWIFLKAALAFLEQLHHDPATGGPSGALVVPDTWPRTRTVVIALATYLDGFLDWREQQYIRSLVSHSTWTSSFSCSPPCCSVITSASGS